MTRSVSDFRSNAIEQVEHAVKVIGRSLVRRKVFAAVYYHKTKAKSVSEIVIQTKLSRMRVLQEGRHLVKEEIVGQTKKDGEIAYEMYENYHRRKRQILSLVDNPKGLSKLPTKRKLEVRLPESVFVPSTGAKVSRITIDDVASFSRVRKVKSNGAFLSRVSEADFKNGVRRILRESDGKKDWGGERNDLHTTRLELKSKRLTAAFAFKGPGTNGTLTPNKMGKNGDQIQRLFQTDAEVFLVQYWRKIDESVLEQMRTFAVVKSLADGKRIYYGIIDGDDSHRLYRAYLESFEGR
jgi:hypothetical protein